MKRVILFLSILCVSNVGYSEDDAGGIKADRENSQTIEYEMPNYFEKMLNRPSEDFNKAKTNELIKSIETFHFPGGREISMEEGQSIKLADKKVRQLVKALKLELHDRLLGVYVNYDPYYEVTLKLKGKKPVPPWMEEIVINNYSAIGFEYGAKYNFQELNQIYNIAMEGIRIEFKGELQGSGVNTKHQTVDLQFYSENNKKAFTKNDLISRLGKYQSKQMDQFLDLPLNLTTSNSKIENLADGWAF